MKVTRREVLKTAAVASAMAAIGGPLTNIAKAADNEPENGLNRFVVFVELVVALW